MRITKYAQSCFLLETDKLRMLIDPGNLCYSESFSPEDFGKIDVLLLTHTHDDHCFPKAVKEINENNPEMRILCNDEVAAKLKEEASIKNATILKAGDKKEFGRISIEAVKSEHGKHPTADKVPKVLGFLINDGSNIIYHPGDTRYFEGMPKADIALLPICGDFVVMNPEDVYKYWLEAKPKLIIPMHYDSQIHPTGTKAFEIVMSRLTGIKYKILKNGESVEV
ncbi:MBL fold metallo-hydrolase [Candidatus Woesearchaeota archaeon]|nr:MAG: MBL fold metallo-hydrolase [Candidatus Woesearchaeota archaeon]